jgi:hypothetical protein
MEDLIWITVVAAVAAAVVAAAIALAAIAGTIAAVAVFGAAAHGFTLTMKRGILHRGGASAARGAIEPAFFAYYRSQVWQDLRLATITGWARAGEETARIRALVPQDGGGLATVFRVVLVVYSWIGLAVGTLLAAVVGLIPALLVALSAAAAWALGAPMRAAERLRRQRSGAHFDCPECHDRFALPAYVCPSCGERHKQLAPGPYGVMKHRCICGARLPAVQFRGRNRLPSECPEFGHALGESVGTVRTFHVPVAGGPSTGKSTYLASALLGMEKAAAEGTLATSVQTSSRDGYDRLLDGFRQGVLPAKTVDTEAPALVAEVRGKTKSALLYAYDVAGEAYGDEDQLRRDPAYGLADGVVLLVDPFALDQVRADLKDELAASSDLRPSAESPQRVLERIVGVFGEKGVELGKVPLALCVTKVDALGIGDAIGAAPGADEDARVRAWLEGQGEGNLIRAASGTFREVRCFSVSALGRSSGTGSGPFVPSGTLDPLIWLMSGAGVEPATAGEARATESAQLESSAPLDVTPKRPLLGTPLNAVNPLSTFANFGIGVVACSVLAVGALPFALVPSTDANGNSDVANGGNSGLNGDTGNGNTGGGSGGGGSNNGSGSNGGGGGYTPPKPKLNAPSRALKAHYHRLASRDYSGAFHLMSANKQAHNSGWIADRSAADPNVKVVKIGRANISGDTAFVPITFYARDRYSVPPSDTKCRHFNGDVEMVREGSKWRLSDSTGLTINVVDPSNPACG